MPATITAIKLYVSIATTSVAGNVLRENPVGPQAYKQNLIYPVSLTEAEIAALVPGYTEAAALATVQAQADAWDMAIAAGPPPDPPSTLTIISETGVEVDAT